MKAQHIEAPAEGYVTQLSERISAVYLDVLSETDPEIVGFLRKKRDVQDKTPDSPGGNLQAVKRGHEYIDFWNGLNEDQKLSFASHDAKINNLWRLARIIGTTEIVQAHNSMAADTAESIGYVLGRFRQEGVAANQLQKFIDENAVAWFSLTGHPTNPATVSYMSAQASVARILTDRSGSFHDLKEALIKFRDTPIVGPRKTPLEEADETLNTLDIIFDHALDHKKLFDEALHSSGYASEGVVIRHPLIRPCVWTLGDGDGNNALTAKVLEDGIAIHRQRIAQRYSQFLDHIVDGAKKSDVSDEVTKILLGLRNKLDIEAIEKAINAIDSIEIKRDLNDLVYLMGCFGNGFAKIDLRHNAVDIIDTLKAVLNASDLSGKTDFLTLSLDEQAIRISAWLDDKDIVQSLASGAELLSAEQETPARIMGRLRVVSRNPDMCDKFIVAEATHPTHMLASLLLLKLAGNEICNEDSRIDVVSLSESVADLIGVGRMIEVMFDSKAFRNHVMHRNRFIAMIAKSDTTRQDGRGEAEYAQYESAVDIYRVTDLIKYKYPELEHVLVSVKNGGGHALQRGGGRVTEVPALHGRAAADARATDIGPSTLTIQGEQQSILFCPGRTAIGTLEALSSHNLYTKAGVQGEMPAPTFSKDINKQYARADARLYAKTAGRAFDRLTKENPAIDELLIAAPWLSMKAGNSSSRPAKRGEKMVGPGITPAEAKGKAPKALAGRAISGERLTAHACLPIFSVLGLLEAMETVRNEGAARMNPEKYGDALHHLYRAHKIHRDGARATINAAAMANFDIAWPLLTGRDRPSVDDVIVLAGKFRHSAEPHSNTPDVTLAFLEDYFLRVEKMTYEMVCGEKAPDTMRHGDALRKLWPDLEKRVSERNAGAEFARVIECYRTRQFDAAPDQPLSEKDFRITQAIYASANVVSAPVGIVATRTRLEPAQGVTGNSKTQFMRPQSYSESEVEHLLHMPKALDTAQ